MTTLPTLTGVKHRFVDVGKGVTIHVADAGPVDGPPVMLVHGVPQHWWEWRYVIGPLVADGYRVLCPDLPGQGWSSAPHGLYGKKAMADDLAAMLDALGIAPVKVVAHDWGGVVAFIMMLRHPHLVSGLFGLNTAAPWIRSDLATVRDLWRFLYQIPIALPVLGPRLVADRKARYWRRVVAWGGGGFSMPADDFLMYARLFQQRDHARAESRLYRVFLMREFVSWLGGEYADARVTVPVRWLHGTADPIITPNLLRGYDEHIDDLRIEFVDGVGHWIVEQRPDLVLDRLRHFLVES